MLFPERVKEGEKERAVSFFIFVSGTRDETDAGRRGKLGGTEATNKSVLERANETVGTREREISFVAGADGEVGEKGMNFNSLYSLLFSSPGIFHAAADFAAFPFARPFLYLGTLLAYRMKARK